MHKAVTTIVLICLIKRIQCEMEQRVGDFKTKSHGVNGTLFISGEKTIILKGFSYDGNSYFSLLRIESYVRMQHRVNVLIFEFFDNYTEETSGSQLFELPITLGQ
jgi:hypothetical protein